jgi:hypothetical protein
MHEDLHEPPALHICGHVLMDKAIFMIIVVIQTVLVGGSPLYIFKKVAFQA